MALHPDSPASPYAILNPVLRWFQVEDALRESSMDKLMPSLVTDGRDQRECHATDWRLIHAR